MQLTNPFSLQKHIRCQRYMSEDEYFYHVSEIDSVLDYLQSSNDGLSQFDANDRLIDIGYNELAKENTITQILQLKAAQMQIQSQLAMAMQPQMQGIPQQGGAQPNEERGPGNPEGNLEGNLVNAGTPQ